MWWRQAPRNVWRNLFSQQPVVYSSPQKYLIQVVEEALQENNNKIWQVNLYGFLEVWKRKKVYSTANTVPERKGINRSDFVPDHCEKQTVQLMVQFECRETDKISRKCSDEKINFDKCSWGKKLPETTKTGSNPTPCEVELPNVTGGRGDIKSGYQAPQ